MSVRRCFPWSQPARFVSLRDKDDTEVALIRQPELLDDASREVLEQAIIEAAFVLRIVNIYEVEEEVEIRAWKVDTKQGPELSKPDWTTGRASCRAGDS